MRIGNPRKSALTQKAVFELRYRYGFAYLDRCGRVTNAILRDKPEWILGNTSPNPQNAPLINTTNNCRFNFSALKIDFGIEQGVGEEALSEENLTEFVQQVDELTQLVIGELDLSEFSRIGFRVWYLFECTDTPEAEEWLAKLGLCSVSAKLLSAFEGELEAASMAFVIESKDRKFRIALGSIERTIPLNLGGEILNVPARSLPKGQREHFIKQVKLKKRLAHNPQFAAMIDIDAFQDEPKIVKAGEFITTSLEQWTRFLQAGIMEDK
jgi:hypothetical protein